MITNIAEAKVLVAAKTAHVLKQQTGEKSWGMLEHRGMLRLAILEALKDCKDDKQRNDAITFVMVAGDAGNASAYRQSLKNADGSKMFPGGKTEKLVTEYQ